MCSPGYGYFQVAGRTIPLCCALLAAVACEAPTEPEPPLIRSATIEVTPDFAILRPGGTVQLSAVVRDQNGDKIGDAGVEWSTENAMVVLVDETGLASAKREGRTEIPAKHDALVTAVGIVVSNDPERYVLTRLYDATDGPNWHRDDNWRTKLAAVRMVRCQNRQHWPRGLAQAPGHRVGRRNPAGDRRTIQVAVAQSGLQQLDGPYSIFDRQARTPCHSGPPEQSPHRAAARPDR